MWMVMNVPPMRLACVIQVSPDVAGRYRRVYETEAEALAKATRHNRIIAQRASEMAEKQEVRLQEVAGE